MAEENRLSWVDVARKPEDEDGEALREAVQLWVIGCQVDMTDVVAADLLPLPEVAPDTALLMLRDRLDESMRKRGIRMEVVGWNDVGTSLAPIFGIGYPVPGEGDGPAAVAEGGWVRQRPAPVGLEAWADFLTWLAWRQDVKVINACERCGKTFAPQRRTAMYCSDACRVAAHLARKEATA